MHMYKRVNETRVKRYSSEFSSV